MNKRFRFIMLLISLLGYLIFTLSQIFRHSLTDFIFGFCEGISFVFIVIWGIYMCYCFARKKSPFMIN